MLNNDDDVDVAWPDGVKSPVYQALVALVVLLHGCSGFLCCSWF